MIRCGTVFIIESGDGVVLCDGPDIVGRAQNITIVADEADPANWLGSMAFDKRSSDVEKLMAARLRVLTVRFEGDGKHYKGLVKITAGPTDIGQYYWVEFRGIDLLNKR